MASPRKESPQKEILYEGYLYDVTDFIKRHPGGEEILEYHTLPGEDATIPIQQFHPRSLNRVLGILKSFKKRRCPAGNANNNNNPISDRHKALTDDYLKLLRELEDEGLFQVSNFHMAYNLMEVIVLAFVGATLLIACTNLWGLLAGCTLLGLSQARCFYVFHSAVHQSVTGSREIDTLINSASLGIWQGVAGSWWRLDHFQHHAMINHIDHDGDLDLSPMIAVHTDVLKGKKPSFIMKYQKWFFPLSALVMISYWKFWHTPRTLLKRRSLTDTMFICIHYYLILNYVPLHVYILATLLATVYLYQLAFNHTFLPVRDTPAHWVENTLLHTSNVQTAPGLDWIMAYQNYHIEHHLFPSLPQYRSHLVADRVKALAARHGLPYHIQSWVEVGWSAVKNLMDVEDEMRKM